MSDSLRLHGLQHTRLPCPSLSLGVCSNSCSLSRWCHLIISSSVALFSSCPPSFPASVSFPMSQFFTSGGQSIGASALASVLPMNIQDWLPSGLTCLISLLSKRLSRVFQLSQSYMTTGKTIALTIWAFVGKVMPLLFNMLSRFIIAFLPRSKHLLISFCS